LTRDRSPKKRPGLKKTYTVPEAAALLRVDRSTVYRMIADGRLSSIMANGRRITGASIWAALRWGKVRR